MHKNICNFEALASPEMSKLLDEEFQRQMDLTDGEYLFWFDNEFEGHNVETPTNAIGQAILQFFANCSCPISRLRLGRSLSKRNYSHGPIVCETTAFQYLLSGAEQVVNNLYDDNVKEGFEFYISTLEFRLACELLMSYEIELLELAICPEILLFVESYSRRCPEELQ